MAKRWTRKQASEIAKRLQQVDGASVVRERRNKYGAQKTQVDGRTFHSKSEAERYVELRTLERAGLIEGLECQVSFDLVPAVVLNGRKTRPLRYVADFAYVEAGERIVEDRKGGQPTKEYVIKRHLMRFVHGIEIRETRKSASR